MKRIKHIQHIREGEGMGIDKWN